MDIGNIIYIVALIAYFIYQATKKKKGAEDIDMPESEPSQPEKGVSFEDLLKEIRDAQQGKRRPSQPVPAPPAQEKRREERFEPVKAEPIKRTRYKSLQEQDDEISYYEEAFEKTQSELLKTSKGIPTIPSVVEKVYEQKSKPRNRYSSLLKDPKTVKDAVVLKEILDRKHF
ncbi:hypothetical protein [Algoriphagus zhangzhouensis]|uniref:Uncharacterized protein n=1 Tax=Algoriphagus zhangzhouensis TaxID=1073327 RepID=A0A1M7Z5T4_9BACT|nr:hypothetical protein [Algoriphagus zhangzhouensis]TDY48951.1 hypothetical protein A8938_0642 [Algoriphagus zhangzhouensis]SHO60204.1 hypothetical protein SAMN04488108_0642 [Algoriphagus zhangzhouensis]